MGTLPIVTRPPFRDNFWVESGRLRPRDQGQSHWWSHWGTAPSLGRRTADSR